MKLFRYVNIVGVFLVILTPDHFPVILLIVVVPSIVKILPSELPELKFISEPYEVPILFVAYALA